MERQPFRRTTREKEVVEEFDADGLGDVGDFGDTGEAPLPHCPPSSEAPCPPPSPPKERP